MSTLFHHTFCPHSRFVRLALNEYGIEVLFLDTVTNSSTAILERYERRRGR